MVILPCIGQRLEIGAKVGIPITDTFETSSFFTIGFGEGATAATRRYTVGPTVGVRLPHGLGIEFDALYRRVGFNRLTKSSGVVLGATHTTANSWEFPILPKVVVGRIPFVKPFIKGGVAFRTLSEVSSTTVRSLFDSMTRSSGTSDPILTNRSSYGAVVGLGAEMRVGPFRLLPEMRYSRWAADRNLDLQLHSNHQNQLDFILGIAF